MKVTFFNIAEARKSFDLPAPAGFDACARMMNEAGYALAARKEGRPAADGKEYATRACAIAEEVARVAFEAIGAGESVGSDEMVSPGRMAQRYATAVLAEAGVLDESRHDTQKEPEPEDVPAVYTARAVLHTIDVLDSIDVEFLVDELMGEHGKEITADTPSG